MWEFDLANEGRENRDETWIKPVKKLPVSDLSNRVMGTQAPSFRKTGVLHDGNIDLRNHEGQSSFFPLSSIEKRARGFVFHGILMLTLSVTVPKR